MEKGTLVPFFLSPGAAFILIDLINLIVLYKAINTIHFIALIPVFYYICSSSQNYYGKN